ncbi:MAG TPA: ABC-2 family transporter protein [Thermomicrobiales bacterium]
MARIVANGSTPAPMTTGLRVMATRYYGIALTSTKEKFVYRFDFFLSLFITLIGMALMVYLWRAIFRAAPTALGYELRDLLTYICLGQAFNFGRIAMAQRRLLFRVNGSLRSGNIVFDLLRPVDYQALQFAEVAGQFVTELVLINVPAYLIALLVFGIAPPASVGAAIGFVLSLVGAFLISFSLDFLLMILAFWTFGAGGLIYARRALIELFAGSLVPLTLFPDGLRTLALLLPFQGLAYMPISIYQGRIVGAAIWGSFLFQLGWAVALALLTRLVWLRARRRLTIQGG